MPYARQRAGFGCVRCSRCSSRLAKMPRIDRVQRIAAHSPAVHRALEVPNLLRLPADLVRHWVLFPAILWL